MQPAASAHGITLTAADTVVFYRAPDERGAVHPVHVPVLTARGKTQTR
jgi:hypothetical protein